MSTERRRMGTCDDDPDDAVWYESVDEDRSKSTVPAPVLTVKQTCECAKVLLGLIFTDADFRRRYYDISRTWHKKYEAGGPGGNYASKWMDLIVSKLPDEYANVTLQDWGNMHAHMFYTLQRAILAITSHNIDREAIANPNAPPHGQAADAPSGVRIRSFHWVPNDNVDPSMSPGAMGFSAVAP